MCNTIGSEERKLKFIGCCTLTDNELSRHYNLDLLTNSELASVGLERKSLIDDYRHLHEMSQLHEPKQVTSISKPFVSKLKRPQFKGPQKPTRPFQYNLLNKFFLCMQSEAMAFCQFLENDLRVKNPLPVATKDLKMFPEEWVLAVYESYFLHLDRMCMNGEEERVISFIGKTLVKFHRKPNPAKLLPGFGFGYGPHYARNRNNVTKKEPKDLKNGQ